jgi:hypothetical protein
VSSLLYGRGYLEDQVAYAKHSLEVSESDVLSWEISRGNPPAEALCLISCLKAAGCAVPLLIDKKFGEDVRRRLVESLSYLPADLSALLLKVIFEGFPPLGKDTLNNIDRMVRECRLIFEAVFNR